MHFERFGGDFMANTKALIIGVSTYFLAGATNLPFCRNDILTMKNAFLQGLNVAPEDTIVCGATGIVELTELRDALQCLTNMAQEDDVLLFYFSGHGTTTADGHFLVLSDCLISTQEMIAYLDAIPAKSKVIFLDCCKAGNFQINGSAVFDIDTTVNDFAGRGYAVIASSSANQSSYPHPNKPISLFTSFLYDTLTSRFIIREGKKSLHDIHKLLFLLLETWNKNNTSRVQTPIYRANIGGTIFFDVQDYTPYVKGQFFYENENYIVYSVEPLHNGIAKRYCVKTILKVPMSFPEISLINHEIVEIVKDLDIFGNVMQERKWKQQPANLIFCYFGLDETDIIRGNYICHTTWADDTQDKNWWYRMSKNCEIINGIHFNIHSYYQSLKAFTEEHTGTKEKLVADTRAIITRMVTLAEQVIAQFNELLNGTKNEEVFRNDIAGIIPEINKLYFEESNLDIPPNDLTEWCQLCSNLSGSIHDFTLFYGQQYFLDRTPENRKACMNMSIKQYYKDLEKLKSIDTTI